MPKSRSLEKKEARIQKTKLYEAFIRCESSLKRFISRFTQKPEDVDELAQEAFLRAFGVELQHEIKSPKAYLFRVARNITLRELNRKNRQLTDYLEDLVDEDLLAKMASIEEELIAQQKIKFCCEAIADLPEQCRRVFLLRKVYALSHKEIAVQLGIAVSTVEKHIAKGVDRFTDYMEQRDQVEVTQEKLPGRPASRKHPWS